MVTTIQIHEKTLNMLKHLQSVFGTKTHEQTIQHLIKKKEGIPDSMFGAHPEMKPFTHKDEAKFHEL